MTELVNFWQKILLSIFHGKFYCQFLTENSIVYFWRKILLSIFWQKILLLPVLLPKDWFQYHQEKYDIFQYYMQFITFCYKIYSN